MNSASFPAPPTLRGASTPLPLLRVGPLVWGTLLAGALVVAAVMVWQALVTGGSPDPTAPGSSPAVAILDIAVLVFREGLECILVLAAITASMTGAQVLHKPPVGVGGGLGLGATCLTWCIAVGIVQDLSDNVSALDLQAGTGLLAVVVLLVVMNWFFHKVYWGGWITLHNRKKKSLLRDAGEVPSARRKLLLGLGLLGFSSLYREGFEVVLFLQGYRLQMGEGIVLAGAAVGLALSAVVAVLTFVAHRRLPYRRMLVLTGVMLGGVLIVMVGEQAQEMQLAHWIPTTAIPALEWLPKWAGVWFAAFPTVETLAAQVLAAALVIGSYYAARRHGSATTAPA